MLKYKVNGDGLLKGNIVEEILRMRGVENVHQYLHLDENACYDYSLLRNINEASEVIIKHIESQSKIAIVVDCDCDGYTAAAALYNYIKLTYTNVNICYLLHKGKEHGLSEDIVIPNDVQLVIIPDAGSNDVEQCKALSALGKDVVILDHHICDADNPYAIIVNSQNDYPNKELSGVGVIYKLLQKMDDDLWQSHADRFIDLVAVGMIGDMMDQRSTETRYLCNYGIKSIRNKLLRSLINAQSFSMSEPPTINDFAFYICPLINAAVRVGDDELKDMMFRALIETDEMFVYKKRGETEEAPEDIYDRCARLLKNNKTKQDKLIEGALETSTLSIDNSGIANNKILFVDSTQMHTRQELSGIVATKIAEMYGKPCLMLRRINNTDVFGGSARNVRDGQISSLKNVLESVELFNEVAGHDNAFGVKIQEKNIIKAIKRINRILKDDYCGKSYSIDFILSYDDITIGLIKELDDSNWVFCNGVDEPLFLIRDIEIKSDDVVVMGKNQNSWKVQNDVCGFEIVQFKCEQPNRVLDKEYDNIKINAICKMGIHRYKGKLTPQIIVKDYEVCS